MRKSATFKHLRNILIGWLGAGLIRLITPTLRVRMTDESGLVTQKDHPPIIFAFWHNRMFVMPWFQQRYFHPRRAACLVSASQDGEMIARVLQNFGLDAIRGSSSRRGREAGLELAECLKQGSDVAITPDGPRGPCYQAHDGMVRLAASSGCQILPVTCRITRKIQLPSWDRFMIPLPFSRCELHFGKLLGFKTLATDEDLKKACAELEKALNRLN